MRNFWIAAALLVLLAGVLAVCRAGGPERPQAAPAAPERPRVRVETPSEGESPSRTAGRRRKDEAAFPPRGGPGSRAETRAVSDDADVDEPEQPPALMTDAVPPAPRVVGAAPVVAGTSASAVAAPAPTAPQKPSPPPPPPQASTPAPPPTSTPRREATTTREPEKEAPTSAPVDDPESDRRPPQLLSLSFDPPEVKDGGATTLSVGCADDLSGIKAVYGAIRSPSGGALISFSARDVAGSGVFSTAVSVPARGETGEWFVANLHLVDRAENMQTLNFARANVPPGGAFRVVSDDSDATPPDVRRVTMVNNDVEAGAKNRIVVEVDDDRSGVALVNGSFQSPSKAAFIPFNCARNGDSPVWEGDVPVPRDAECGEWILRQLRVVDRANNSAFLSADSPQLGRVAFYVSGGSCDAEPPYVDALYFTPTAVSNETASEVVLTISAHDDGAGVASVTGWIEGPVATNGQSPRIYFESVADPRDRNAPMTARIAVPQFAAKGVWRVALAQVTDRARNTRAYNRNDPALRDATFNVD